MAIDWGAGYRAHWRVHEVDPSTWADGAALPGATAITVTRDATGDAPALESGSLSLDAPVGGGWRERYLRVAMVAEQAGVRERVDVCTMLFSMARGTSDRGADALELTGRSVLHPASVALAATGGYAPKGSDGATFAASMLADVLAAPVEVDPGAGFTLGDHVVFATGDSVLASAWAVLSAGNHVIQVTGDGTVRVMARPTTPALVLGSANARLLVPGITHELDLSGVPNRYVAVDGAASAVATNDDPASETSTVTRGYRVDVIDTSPKRVNGETLYGYARRRLMEASVVSDSRTWSREWWPGVYPNSLVRAAIPAHGIEGDFRVTRQSLTCGHGIVVEEQAVMEVPTWVA